MADPAQSHTFVEIDHKLIFTASLLLPLIQERLSSVVNRLVKLTQEKDVVM